MTTISNLRLLEDEILLDTVIPRKGFMFRNNDIVKFPFFVLWIVVAFTILFFSFKDEPVFFSIVPIILIIYSTYTMVKTVISRYNNTVNTEYVITNKRVIFLKNSKPINSLFFKDLDEINYENKGGNKGYITLGKTVDLFAGGINLEDDKHVLDNLTEYNSTSSLIKRLYAEK